MIYTAIKLQIAIGIMIGPPFINMLSTLIPCLGAALPAELSESVTAVVVCNKMDKSIMEISTITTHKV